MDVLVQQVLGVPGIVKLKGQLPLRDWYSARGGLSDVIRQGSKEKGHGEDPGDPGRMHLTTSGRVAGFGKDLRLWACQGGGHQKGRSVDEAHGM